jgi:signal transduction histidine kinase
MRRPHRWPFVLAGIVVAALAVLAMKQFDWIRRLSETREQRERAELESAARRFDAEIEIELSHLGSAFELREEDAGSLMERYERWRATAADPRFLAAILIIKPGPDGAPLLFRFDPRQGQSQRVEWPPQLAGVRARIAEGVAPFGPDLDLPGLLLPLGRGEKGPVGAMLLQIDSGYLLRDLMPDLARRFFAAGNYDVAVSHDEQIVFRSNAAWPASVAAADPDLAAPLFEMKRRRERMEHLPPPPPPSPWRLLVRHHGAPLAEVIAAERRRDMALASLVLLLLAAVAIALALAARRADQLRQQQLEFVAGITHELNTPLAALGAAGQNLADGVAVDTVRYGEAIVKETRRLIDLVDQVLQFGGLESVGAPALGRAAPRAAIDDALAQCRWMAEERGVVVECNAAEDLPAVRGDAASVTRAVQNLVANAIRHGGDGKWVGVRAGREDGFVAITVEDRGPGIAPADLPHLFEPFYRGRNAQTRGSGIGLAIVDRIARAHGGRVSVARRRESGAAFTLRLPVAETPP